MKLLSSSTSSASSTISTTTSTNFSDGNFYNSRNAATGCISGVIRRLLCRSSLPTHPADHFREAVSAQELKFSDAEDEIEPTGTPSIVARLMGLESMPQVDFGPAGKSPNSFSRSRSMNSAESSKEFELIRGRHRRVKSFREIPTYIELEDEKFFILSFESGYRRRKMASRERKSDKGRRDAERRSEEKRVDCGETKPRRESNGGKKDKRREDSYGNNKENFGSVINDEKEKKRVVSYGLLKNTMNVLRPVENDSQKDLRVGMDIVKLSEPVNHMENSEERRRIKKKTKDDCLDVKLVEQELDSQNSSPNSVLDFPDDREAPSSAEVSRVTNSKSRRTLWEELENYRKLNPCRDKGTNSNDGGPKASLSMPLLQNKVYQGHKHVQMWRQICKVADRETLQPNWIGEENLKLEHYKRIGRDLELAVLDQVVEELVDQLAANGILKL